MSGYFARIAQAGARTGFTAWPAVQPEPTLPGDGAGHGEAEPVRSPNADPSDDTMPVAWTVAGDSPCTPGTPAAGQ